MDRRESIKSLLVASMAGGLGFQGCTPEEAQKIQEISSQTGMYGRTPEEKALDEKLKSKVFFTDQELDTIAILCDIILPTSDAKKGAADAEVSEFIEFIAKDMPRHQVPIRGGVMWLDGFANRTFNKVFSDCDDSQQIKLVDQIAYPDRATKEVSQGVSFFSLIRNLTLTGYYTTRIGIEELGYKGNTPNVWDGVPDDVLKEHGMEYPADWLPHFVDQSKRDVKAEWDEDGNLIT